jgi:hypothetical protein
MTARKNTVGKSQMPMSKWTFIFAVSIGRVLGAPASRRLGLSLVKIFPEIIGLTD